MGIPPRRSASTAPSLAIRNTRSVPGTASPRGTVGRRAFTRGVKHGEESRYHSSVRPSTELVFGPGAASILGRCVDPIQGRPPRLWTEVPPGAGDRFPPRPRRPPGREVEFPARSEGQRGGGIFIDDHSGSCESECPVAWPGCRGSKICRPIDLSCSWPSPTSRKAGATSASCPRNPGSFGRSCRRPKDRGLCELEIRTNVTLRRGRRGLPSARSRVAIFHFAGHADADRLLLESAAGGSRPPTPRGWRVPRRPGGPETGLPQRLLDPPPGGRAAPQGIDVVVATARPIDDDVAREFAVDFYQQLVAGRTFRDAFAIARELAKADRGSSPEAFLATSAALHAGGHRRRA